MNKKNLSIIIAFVVYFFAMQNMCYALYGIFAAKKVINKMEEPQPSTDNQSVQAVQKDVQTLLNGVAKAFDAKNIDEIAASATTQASLDYMNGRKITIDEWKANAKQEFADIKNMRTTFKVESVTPYGKVANATYTETHDYALNSDEGHQYQSVGRWNATLIMTANGWRISYFKEVAERTTRDNRLFTPQSSTPKF